jgi:hypothetical protein
MEQPCHGASPVLKLVTQPSAQLPLMFAIFSSFAVGDIVDAGGVAVVDVRGDTVMRATARVFGLSALVTCFGASTTTLGSAAVPPPEGVAARDVTAPGPHTSAIDRVATARLAAKSDENLMVMSCQMPGQAIPSRSAGYHVPAQAVKLRRDRIGGILRNQFQSGDRFLTQSG